MGAALKMLPGVAAVNYDPERDLFSLEYDPERARIEDIFAAVVQGGKQMGREYRPRVMV